MSDLIEEIEVYSIKMNMFADEMKYGFVTCAYLRHNLKLWNKESGLLARVQISQGK